MALFLDSVAWILLITLIAGLVRIVKGPTRADRLMAAQILGTVGIAILLIVGHRTGQPSFFDVALFLSVLAAVTTVAFIRMVWRARPSQEDANP